MGAGAGPVCSHRACGGAFLTAQPAAKAPQSVIIPFSCTNPQRAVKCRSCGCAVWGCLVALWGWSPLTSVPPQPRGCWQHVLRCPAWGHHPDSHRRAVWQHAWLHDPAGVEKAEGEWVCPQALTSFVLAKPLELLLLLLILKTFVLYIKTPTTKCCVLKRLFR